MNIAINRPLSASCRWLRNAALFSCLVLAACSADNTTTIVGDNPTVSVGLPDILLDADFLNADNLRPVVTLDNGATVSMNLIGDQRWSGQINLPVNVVYKVTVTWVERINGQDLPLARRTLDLAVGNDGSAEQSAISDYDTNFDSDGDGVSNFEERRDGSDPFPAETPEGGEVVPPTPVDPVDGPADSLVRLAIPLPMPDFLADASFLNTADLRPVVTINTGATVTASQVTGSDWSGTVDVPADAVYKVTITWVELFRGEDLPLARRSVDYAVGKDGSVQEATGTGYGIDFDSDDDGPSNFAERRDGTDPLVKDSGEAVSGTVPPENVNTVTPLPQTADVIIPRISTFNAPTIDGLNVTLGSQDQFTGEWVQAIQSDISGETLSIDRLMIDIDAEAPGNKPFRRWAAMHDGVYLYVVVIVDDNGQRERDSNDIVWDDDSLELFLDADNSKSQVYDENDFHRIFPVRLAGAGASKVGVTSGDVLGPNSTLAPLTIDFATGPGIGPDGIRRANFEQDVYELRIPLGMAGISSDAPFGFELQVNDDDDGLRRDSKWGWSHPARNGADTDHTFANPSFMGTVILE